ncbi:AraC family transcriptional regulator [Dyella choica]|uniref:AraC family transcriptional regulator n=1 Tax=Dyella choica TaxID=1927959 RepID=A0A3S0WYC9_9GAMM|nr:AraC family transcriptional regulator [Dyella choica]RUL79048.1 AraC family transcriptional regulator [Dyella choica]
MKTHQIIPHRSRLPGVEAWSLFSEHAFPRHAHDQFGIGVITAGAQKSWSGAGTVESAVGDVIMVNPGEMHDGSPIGGAREWHILYLEPSLVLRELADELGGGDVEFRPVARDRSLAAEVIKLLGSLESVGASCDDAQEQLLACLVRIMQRYRMSGPRLPRTSPAIARAVEWIDAEPDAATPLCELAAACGMSRFQLIRGFMRDMGTTPHAYRIQQRVRLARRCLAQGHCAAEAAALSGFADQSHLTRAFVRQLGITPARYHAALA